MTGGIGEFETPKTGEGYKSNFFIPFSSGEYLSESLLKYGICPFFRAEMLSFPDELIMLKNIHYYSRTAANSQIVLGIFFLHEWQTIEYAESITLEDVLSNNITSQAYTYFNIDLIGSVTGYYFETLFTNISMVQSCNVFVKIFNPGGLQNFQATLEFEKLDTLAYQKIYGS